MGWRAGLGRASGAEPPSLRSSGAHSAALPESGIQGRSRDDALSSCPHPGQHPAARERSPEESIRGRGLELELPQGSFVLRALSTESRREIQGGLRSILASFSGASRSFCASAAGVRPFPGRTAPGAGRQRLPVAVFPTLWYFAALFFPGRRCTVPPFPCLSAERRNSGVK